MPATKRYGKKYGTINIDKAFREYELLMMELLPASADTFARVRTKIKRD